MYEYLTGREFADFYAKNCGIKKADPKNFLFEVNSTNLIKEYSTGMKKKTYINAVLQIPDYKIYVFDEPFNDLDIEANYRLLQHIRKLAETHVVLLSSHIIEIVLPYLKQCYFIENTKVEPCPADKLVEKFFTRDHAF
jgi:ABC-2 type transport system ATP-binding protein